jgi:hypothetical protein
VLVNRYSVSKPPILLALPDYKRLPRSLEHWPRTQERAPELDRQGSKGSRRCVRCMRYGRLGQPILPYTRYIQGQSSTISLQTHYASDHYTITNEDNDVERVPYVNMKREIRVDVLHGRSLLPL